MVHEGTSGVWKSIVPNDTMSGVIGERVGDERGEKGNLRVMMLAPGGGQVASLISCAMSGRDWC